MREWSSLFTDIVGSTEKAVALGDAAWAELHERHHAAVRAERVIGIDITRTSPRIPFGARPERLS